MRLRSGVAPIVAFLGAFAASAAAQSNVITAQASLGAGAVAVGQQFIFTVEVSGTQTLDRDPVLPDVSGFARVLGSGTTTSMRIVNGRRSVSVMVQYRLEATTEGTYEIGPVTVFAGGVEVSTMPVRLTVGRAPPPGATPVPGGDGVDLGPEDVFLTADVSRRQVLQNEPVVVEYRIYTRVNVSSYSLAELPPAAGFWVEEFELPGQPEVEQIVRNGQQYVTALIRKVAMFPTGPGTKIIEPLSIEARVRVPRSRTRDPFGGLLDRSSLFSREIATTVSSPSVEVEVLPLPSADRPADFSGMVGDLSIATTLDRDSVAVNGAVTMRVDVSGSGNLKALAPPELDLPPTLEAFPPETEDRLSTTERGVTGTRTYEYVLIPRAPGRLTIPEVAVSYFDPSTREYGRATAAPLELTVAGRAGEAALPGAGARGEVEALRTDIRFIEIDTPRFDRVGASPLASAWFWVTLLGPIGLLGGAVGFRRHRDRLAGDVALARSRRAGRVAKKRLATARRLARDDDPRAFFAETGRALTGFIADRLNVSAAGIIRDEMRPSLRARGVSEETVDECLGCLDVCDRERFAPGRADGARHDELLRRVEAAMSALDRELKG